MGRGAVQTAAKLAAGMSGEWHPDVKSGRTESNDLVDRLCSTFRLQRRTEAMSELELVEFMLDLSLTVGHGTFALWMTELWRLPPPDTYLNEKELQAWWQEGAF